MSNKKPTSKETGRSINTGGGVYIEGKVDTGGGDFVGRDKIVQSGASADEIATAFLKLYKGIEKIKDADERSETQEIVKKLEAEARKGEQADEKKVQRWFTFLAGMSEDVWDVAITTFANPILGVGKVFQKIAQKAKEEKPKLLGA